MINTNSFVETSIHPPSPPWPQPSLLATTTGTLSSGEQSRALITLEVPPLNSGAKAPVYFSGISPDLQIFTSWRSNRRSRPPHGQIRPKDLISPPSNTPLGGGQVVENDVDTPPDNRIKFIIFLAKTIGIDVENDLKDIADRRGKKKLVQFTKTVLYREILPRDPNAKVNKSNTSLDAMWKLLPALTDERDVMYIRSQYSSIRQRLVQDVEETDQSIARRQDTDVWRFFLLIPKFQDLRRAYTYSQTPSHREMLDGRETYKSRFLKLMVQYFNDSNISVSTPSQPSLHSCFSEPILCDKGDFELTEEKAKKILGDSRRHLTTMINDWERSGNGSNQQRLDEDVFDELGDFDAWGRFDPGSSKQKFYSTSYGSVTDYWGAKRPVTKIALPAHTTPIGILVCARVCD
eukprot:g4770.t1 g4770   contig16:314033-315247(+)